MTDFTGPTQVAIIGGGWAGMAAAAELASRKIPVTVFEAANTLGGRARRVTTNGVALDNGLHILAGAYEETLRMIRMVSGADENAGLLRMPLRLRVEPDFHLRAPRLPAPLHLAVAIAFARGLGISAKIAAMRFVRRMQSTGFKCDAGLTTATLLHAQRQPRELVERLWNPLCIAALNTNPEQANAQIFLNVIRDCLAGTRAASDLLLPKTDFSALFPEPAAEFVKRHGGTIQLGQAVRSVRVCDDGFEVAALRAVRCSHLIIAVGPHQLEKLAGHIPQLTPQLDMLRQFDYQPIHSVFLQYPAEVKLPEPMIGMLDSLIQWVFDRGQLCGQPGMLGVVISASGHHQSLTREELAQRVHEQLAQRFSLPQPHWSQVIAEKRATFTAKPQLERPANETLVPGLYLAGDYTASPYPATLEAAVRSGLACARNIVPADE
jgi:hydroxysqualene dehydroxylase